MERHDEPFLITRSQAAKRYGMSQRQFDDLYRQYDEFPVLRIGKRVMIHRPLADDFFTRYVRDIIDVE